VRVARRRGSGRIGRGDHVAEAREVDARGDLRLHLAPQPALELRVRRAIGAVLDVAVGALESWVVRVRAGVLVVGVGRPPDEGPADVRLEPVVLALAGLVLAVAGIAD